MHLKVIITYIRNHVDKSIKLFIYLLFVRWLKRGKKHQPIISDLMCDHCCKMLLLPRYKHHSCLYTTVCTRFVIRQISMLNCVVSPSLKLFTRLVQCTLTSKHVSFSTNQKKTKTNNCDFACTHFTALVTGYLLSLLTSDWFIELFTFVLISQLFIHPHLFKLSTETFFFVDGICLSSKPYLSLCLLGPIYMEKRCPW